MNTEQLRYFVSVARYRNFTETAREFYVTQPAVTHQISALEREVSARLFLRTTRNVSLTRAGELFLEDAKRILDQEERALGRLRQLEASGCWELRIGYLNSPSRKLGADFYCLVCPREHPCLDNAVIDYAKLATEPFACLSHTGGAYMYKQFLQICRGLGFTPASVTEYPALEDVIFAVECGQAIAILPFRIREYMHTTGLAFVPLEGHGQTIELGVAWREPSDNPAVEWFMAMVNRWLLEHPELF